MRFQRKSKSARTSSRRPKKHALSTRPHAADSAGRLSILRYEPLEDRRMLATFAESGTTLNISLGMNDAVGIASTGGSFTLTLTSGTWSGSGANTSLNSPTNTILTATNNSADFTQVNITDSGTGTSVAFNDSNTNSYACSFDVTLDDSPASNGLTFANPSASSFGANNLTASVDTNIVLNSGANLSATSGDINLSTNSSIVLNSGANLSTSSGGITLNANQQATATTGNFVGINVNGATITTATGAITLAGTGGNSGSGNYGVEIQGNGTVKATGASPGLLSITGAPGDGSSAGIIFNKGAVASTGAVTLTGGGSILETQAGAGADISGTTVTLTTTGSGNQIGTAAVGGPSTPLLVNATLLNATTDDGFITIANTSGNMALGALSAGTGPSAFIELTSVGAITDGNNGAGSPNLSASDGAQLTTTNSNGAIGTSALPIRTEIGFITATTFNGGIYISDSNSAGLIVNSLLAQEAGYPPVTNKNNQVVYVDSSGNQHVGTKNVVLTATGPILLATAQGVTTTVAATGTVTLDSTGGSISQGTPGSSNIFAQSATLTANGSIGAQGGAPGLTVESFSASSTNGNIYLSELIPGTVTSAIATGTDSNVSIAGSGATLNVKTVTATGTVTLQETNGQLVSDASTDVTAPTVNLSGKLGIGSSVTAFTVNAANLSTTATNAGAGTFVTDNSALSTVSATTNAGDVTIHYPSGGSLQFNAGTAVLAASGTATVSFDNTGGDVVLGAVTASTITASGAIKAGPGVDLSGGALTLTAGTGIGATGSPIDTNVTSLNATTTTGDIVIVQAAGPFTVNAASQGYTDPTAKTGSDVNISTTSGDMTVGAIAALGTVTLDSGGAILAGTGNPFNVAASTLSLIAAAGIGASASPLTTAASTLSASGGADGVFVSNNKTVSLTSASATGGPVDITTIGDLNLTNTLSAPNQAVTLSATGALNAASGAQLDAQSATLSGASIGSSSAPWATNLSSLVANAAIGGIYINDANTATITLTATSAGQGSNVVFTSAGNINLKSVTAKGNSVTLTAAGSITNGLTSPGVNITAQDLTITAPGGIGTSANPLEILVAQIDKADGGTPGVFMDNAGPVAITSSALTAAGTGTLTFDAASITILELGSSPVALASGRSLVLKTETGPIVFLDQANTIETSGGGSITIEAGTTPKSGGVAVVGNLDTSNGNGNITITADYSITIGELNAGTGNVTVQSASGIILDGNGPSHVNIIAGTTTLSGNGPTVPQLDLDRDTKIAAAAGASAVASADQTTYEALSAQLPIINSQVAALQQTLASDQAAATALDNQYASAVNELNTLNLVVSSLQLTDLVVDTGVDIALAIAGPAQAIPAFGDGGACAVYAGLKIAEDVIRVGIGSAQVASNAQAFKVTQLGIDDTAADILAGDDNATLQAELLTQTGTNAATAIAQAAAANALLASETAAVVSAQAIAALDQVNVIGSPTDPIGLQVTGTVNVTAGPTDSYLQVVGNTDLGQIIATGSVTLISTGYIHNGEPAGTPNIVATGLNISAVNGIGTAANPLQTQVGALNATNTTSGVINISNNTGLSPGAALDITGITSTSGGNVTIANVGDAALDEGITVTGPISVTGAGSDILTLNSGSPLTISANITAAGPIVETALPDSPPNDNLTVDSGVTIQSTGPSSSISLVAGNNIDVQAGSTLEAAGPINITGGKTSSNVVVEGTLIGTVANIGVDPATNNQNIFTITPSATTPITLTGGSLPGTNTLNFNADGLPVTILNNTITAAGMQPLTFTDIATVNLLNPAGSGSVIVDGTPNVNNTLALNGTGPEAGTFTLNGGPVYNFSGTTSFAFNGANLNNQASITPFATDVLAWGVAITITGGGGANLINYNGVSGISENIVVQPSAPDAGQIIDTNASTGASIVVVNYLNNSNIVVNGSSPAGTAGDVDSLLLKGTDPGSAGDSGNETFTANFAAAGTAAAPNVAVTDSVSGKTLYNLQNLTNFNTLNVTMGGGDDTFNMVNAGSALNFNIAGGSGANTLDAEGAGTFSVYPGSSSDSGSLSTPTNNGNSIANVSFSGIQNINLTGAGPHDDLQVFGTGGNDVFTQEETGVTVNGGPAIGFNPLAAGNGFTQVNLFGGGGDDQYDVDPSELGTTTTLNVVSDVLASGSTLSVTAAGQKDSLTVVPTAAGQGLVSDNNTAGQLGLLTYSGIAGISLVGVSGDGDTAGVTGTAGNDTLAYTPGAAGGSGAVTGTLDAGGAVGGPFELPAVTFSQMSSTGPVALFAKPTLSPLPSPAPVITGGTDTAVINGTAGNDNFAVAAVTGTVNLNNVAVTTGGAANLVLNGLAGSDIFTLNASMPYANVAVSGANTSNNDAVVLNGAPGAIAVNLGNVSATPPTLTSISGYNGAGTVTLSNIAQASINGSGAAANTLAVNGTPNDDQINYTPTLTGGAADGGNFSLNGLNTAFTFNIGNAATNTFTINGGGATGGDQVSVYGPSSGSSWVADEAARTVTVSNAAGTALKPVILGTGGINEVQTVNLLGGLGSNTFLVSPAPGISLAGKSAQVGAANFQAPNDLLVNVGGGGASSQNALVIGNPANPGNALAPTLFAAVMRDSSTSGVIRTFQDSTAAEPIQYPDITYSGVGTVQTNTLTKGVTQQQTLVMGPDQYEPNSSFATAAYLGSGATLNAANLAIFPNNEEFPNVNADQEWFRVVAQATGTLDFQVYFQRQFFINSGDAALPGAGELNIDVYDANGNLISNFGANSSASDNQRRRIPVVAGESYYLQVQGTTPLGINGYSMTIVNTPAAAPDSLGLNNVVAQGLVNNSVAPTATTFAANNAPVPVPVIPPNFQTQPLPPLSTIDNFYDGMYLEFTSGALVGQRQLVSGYVAATHTFTFAAAFSAAPAAADTFQIESDDTGRSQLDNLTRDNLPTIYVRLAAAATNNAAPYFDALQDLAGGGATVGNPPSGSTGNGDPPKTTPILIPFWAGNAASAPFSPNNGSFRVALYDVTNPVQQTFLGYANVVPGEPGVFQLQVTTPLADGTHVLAAKIQYDSPSEQAGGTASMNTFDNGPATQLSITVDTVPPPVYFGTPTVPNTGLVGASDTGVPGQPATIADRITADSTPTFFGVAEANAIIKVYAVVTGNSTTAVANGDILLGQTVATPTDGTNQDPNGQWSVTSAIDLNDPRYGFPLDGLRTLLVTAEDAAGNVSAAKSLQVFIDTQGPTINGINITGSPNYPLFNTKLTPTPVAAPTPLISSLDITFNDLPVRVGPSFVYPAVNPALATTASNYTLVGENGGVIPITSVTLVDNTVAGGPGNTVVTLHFPAKDTPLPDDRYTLSVSDSITDNAGNALQGSFNGVNFPTGLTTGNGSQGQTFMGAFTVDSRAHIGNYSSGTVDLDINGNGIFDPSNTDANNRDAVIAMGYPSDRLFDGNFSTTYSQGAPHTGTANGFDKLATYGAGQNGTFQWTYNLDGADKSVTAPVPQPIPIDGLPVAGNFDGVAADGDQVGLFDSKAWYLDVLDQGYISAADIAATATATHPAGKLTSDMAGFPFVGNFDGYLDLATYQAGVMEFDLASLDPGHVLTGNWNVKLNVESLFPTSIPFNTVTARPVAGFMDGVGQQSSFGLWIPNRNDNTPGVADWYILNPQFNSLNMAAPIPAAGVFTSGLVTAANAADQTALQQGNLFFNLVHHFQDVPLGGQDTYAEFGDQFSLPLLGIWDPPTDGTPAGVSNGALSAEVADTWLINLYTQILDRPPTADEMNQWVGKLANGETPAQIAETIVTGTEYRYEQINKLYQQYLGRSAEQAGLAWFANIWNQTGGPEVVQADIISSPEFLATAQNQYPGLSPQAAWVTALYQRLLGRPASDNDVTYWVKYYNTNGPAAVVLGFVTSPEYHYDTANAEFETYLGRALDAASGQAIVTDMENGLTSDDLLTIIVSSDEYINKPVKP